MQPTSPGEPRRGQSAAPTGAPALEAVTALASSRVPSASAAPSATPLGATVWGRKPTKAENPQGKEGMRTPPRVPPTHPRCRPVGATRCPAKPLAQSSQRSTAPEGRRLQAGQR
jgi:hypothetical protein